MSSCHLSRFGIQVLALLWTAATMAPLLLGEDQDTVLQRL
jgi:hypothetical protein